jgi:tetratricopeptide (TPR) repeat protein
MILALVLAATLQQAYFTPAEAQAIFRAANDAYYREDYAAAAAEYQKLLEHGFGGADVLYNLGTTHLAAGSLGKAVLHFERARLAGAQSEDLDANLALAKSRQLDQIIGQGEEPFLERLVQATSAEAVALGLLIASGLGFASLTLRRLVPSRRTALGVAALGALGVAAVFGALVGAHAYVEARVRHGVVMARTLPVREFPRPAARPAFELHEGLKVRVLAREGGFVQLRLPNGLQGWADASGVEVL